MWRSHTLTKEDSQVNFQEINLSCHNQTHCYYQMTVVSFGNFQSLFIEHNFKISLSFQLVPENAEEYVDYLTEIGWLDEAAVRLAAIVNNVSTILK